MKVELNAQDLAGLRSAVARNPRLVLQETGKFLKRGIAAYMQTINQTPWRVGGSPAGSPINKGTLRESHQPASIGTWEAKIEPNRTGKAPYACVYGRDTRVQTRNGVKSIGAIKVGEYVLTQTGEYHKVLATPRFKVKDKPFLTELEFEYRKDKVGKIILTQDHKVFVKRNGAYCWVEAGSLKKTDKLLRQYKLSHNKGTRIVKKCLECGAKYQTQGRLYCSIKCRNTVYKKEHPQRGSKRSEKARQRISEANTKRLKDNPETHINRVLAKRGLVTSHEKEVSNWLDNFGVSYEKKKKIGCYFVDFYCPSLKTIIEADGAYWHSDQLKDIKRDKDLLNLLPEGWKIIHLHFTDVRFSKEINEKPIENSIYLQVNPSMKSFVNLERFYEIPIFKIKNFKKEILCNKDSLYDLTVDKVHSFVASGIIISNSYVHEGTRHMQGRPWLDHARNKNQNKITQLQNDLLNNVVRDLSR